MVLISGPSGSGKSTICKRIREDERVVFSVSATTRGKRPGEVDGRDYRFLDKEDFRRRVDAGEFIEFAEVYGNMYGTLRAPMEEALAAEFSPAAISHIKIDDDELNDDMHAAADYRAELVAVLARRAVAAALGERPE